MDATITVAIIGAVAVVVAALISQTNMLDRALRRSRFVNLRGRWEAIWVDLDDDNQKQHREYLEITKQRGTRVYGQISVEGEPDKRWSFEGNFNGRFLQLIYFPAQGEYFLDYGCYFFEIQGDGNFEGYSVGFDWSANKIGASVHSLKRIK